MYKAVKEALALLKMGMFMVICEKRTYWSKEMGWTARVWAILFLLILTRLGKRTRFDIHPTSP